MLLFCSFLFLQTANQKRRQKGNKSEKDNLCYCFWSFLSCKLWNQKRRHKKWKVLHTNSWSCFVVFFFEKCESEEKREEKSLAQKSCRHGELYATWSACGVWMFQLCNILLTVGKQQFVEVYLSFWSFTRSCLFTSCSYHQNQLWLFPSGALVQACLGLLDGSRAREWESTSKAPAHFCIQIHGFLCQGATIHQTKSYALGGFQTELKKMDFTTRLQTLQTQVTWMPHRTSDQIHNHFNKPQSWFYNRWSLLKHTSN